MVPKIEFPSQWLLLEKFGINLQVSQSTMINLVSLKFIMHIHPDNYDPYLKYKLFYLFYKFSQLKNCEQHGHIWKFGISFCYITVTISWFYFDFIDLESEREPPEDGRLKRLVSFFLFNFLSSVRHNTCALVSFLPSVCSCLLSVYFRSFTPKLSFDKIVFNFVQRWYPGSSA